MIPRHLAQIGYMTGKKVDIWHNGRLELSVPRVGNSYRCRGEVVLPEKGNAAKLSPASWHLRFGHIGQSTIAELAKKDLVAELDMDDKVSGSAAPCDACLRGKHSRSPFPSTGRTRATKPLELVHSDLSGPFPTTSHGHKYYASFLDDHSEYGVIYRLKEKSEVAFKDYRLRAEKHTGHQLKAIQTDNGGEY